MQSQSPSASRGGRAPAWRWLALLAVLLVAFGAAALPSHAQAHAGADGAAAEATGGAAAAPEWDAQQAALLALHQRTAADAARNNEANARAIEAAVAEFQGMEIKSSHRAAKPQIAPKKGGQKRAAAPPRAAPPQSSSGQCAAGQLAAIKKLDAQLAGAEAEAKKLGCVRGQAHPTRREQCRQIWCRVDALTKMKERAKKGVALCNQIDAVRDLKLRDAKKRVQCVRDEPKRRAAEKARQAREEQERRERERKRREEEERKRKELARQKAIAAAKRKEAARLAELARQKRLREEAEARRNKEAARVRRLNAHYASPRYMEVSVHRHKGAAPEPGKEGHGGKGDVTVIQARVPAPHHKPIRAKSEGKKEAQQKKKKKARREQRKAERQKRAEKEEEEEEREDGEEEEEEAVADRPPAAAPASARLLPRTRNLASAPSATPCVRMCRDGEKCAGPASPSFLEQSARALLATSARTRSYSQQRAAPKAKAKKAAEGAKDFCAFVFRMSAKEQAGELARARKQLAALEAELKKLLAALQAHLSLPALPLACPKKVHLPFTFASATASGDPHVDTFDGAHHDVMVAGWFTWVENPVLTVQAYSQLGCMPASVPNTCLRAVVVRIRPPGTDEQLLVSWGQWPPEGKMQNIVIQDSTSGRSVNQHPNAYKAAHWLGGKYSVAMAGGNLRIAPVGGVVADPELAVSVTIGTYFLAVTLPNAAPHRGATNGLMGFFVGHRNRNDVQNIFRTRGAAGPNPAMKPNSIHGQTPEIRDWAASHVLSGPGGKNPPIPLAASTGLKQQQYLNAHAQHIRHAGFLEMAAGSGSGSGSEVAAGAAAVSLALAEAAAEFSPIPRASKALVLPSVTPPVTPAKLAFCKQLLAAGQKASKSKKAAVFAAQLASCLQDADSPTVARTVATAITVARTQQRAATKALRKKVVRDEARCANTGRCAALPRAKVEVVYNADSPLSADDLRRLRQTHADLWIPAHAKLVAQDTLDRAGLALDDAHAAKKAMLDQYPTVE